MTQLQIYLIRHGDTLWTESGQHTGSTDIELTEKGRSQAIALKKHLEPLSFDAIISSPMQRALHTCELAGFKQKVRIDSDALEWDYGEYEGLTTEEIHEKDPGWSIFSNGAPNGESLRDITVRADRLIKSVMQHKERVAIFSHGHFLRAFAARWLQLPAQEGALFSLDVASISILGFEHQRHTLHLWNFTNAI